MILLLNYARLILNWKLSFVHGGQDWQQTTTIRSPSLPELQAPPLSVSRLAQKLHSMLVSLEVQDQRDGVFYLRPC